jgi:predicted deacylase
MQNKTIIAILLAVAIVAIGATALWWPQAEEPGTAPEAPAEPTPEVTETPGPAVSVIGSSVEGRVIEAYTFGAGETKLLFVGGIHGGYEWNSVVLAYDFIDYFTENPALIPNGLTITVIPNLNPDAVFAVVGKEGRFSAAEVLATESELAAARFNANDVDLNRNFDCKWAPESTWRGQTVSAGTGAFSEPEAAALRDYVTAHEPDAAIFWHSQSNTVYASECEAGIIPETLAMMQTYAGAADYNTQASFDAYSITGDAEGWLASIGIPAITVELETHTLTDWQRNVRGVTALLNYYSTNLAR